MEPELLRIVLTILSIICAVMTLGTALFKHRRMAIIVGASSLVIISGAVVFSYVLGQMNFWAWPAGGVPMALVTAVCFLITGGCLLGLSLPKK